MTNNWDKARVGGECEEQDTCRQGRRTRKNEGEAEVFNGGPINEQRGRAGAPGGPGAVCGGQLLQRGAQPGVKLAHVVQVYRPPQRRPAIRKENCEIAPSSSILQG